MKSKQHAPSQPAERTSGDPVPCQVCAARQSCLLGRQSVEHQRLLAPFLREVPFLKGDPLLSEGVVSDTLKTIKLGTVMVTRRGPDGVARPVALLGRGHVLGKYAAIGHETQLGGYGLAQGRICEMRVDDLHRLKVIDDDFMAALHAVMVRSFGRLADWLQVMRMQGLPRQLLATLLLLCGEQGNRVVRLPGHVALADVLSTSRESIVRTLGILEEAGVLRRVGRWHVELSEHCRDFLTTGEPPSPEP